MWEMSSDRRLDQQVLPKNLPVFTQKGFDYQVKSDIRINSHEYTWKIGEDLSFTSQGQPPSPPKKNLMLKSCIFPPFFTEGDMEM